MDNWKPKVGEWFVYDNPKRGKKEIYKAGETICWEYRLQPRSIKHLRPAVLDDFSVEIKGYGKVWFVDDENKVVIYTDGGKPHLKSYELYYFLKDNIVSMWHKTALISHYNITVMPSDLWEKLRKAK